MGFEPTTASLEGWNSTTELRPPFFSSVLNELRAVYSCPTRHPCPLNCPLVWWAGKDSNLGSRWQQIYSLPPLATWVPARNTLHGNKNQKLLKKTDNKQKQADPRTAPPP
jgi:hypothetical protein